MGLNDADVEAEFVEHVADNGGPEGDDADADTEDQHQASDPDGRDSSDVGPQASGTEATAAISRSWCSNPLSRLWQIVYENQKGCNSETQVCCENCK